MQGPVYKKKKKKTCQADCAPVSLESSTHLLSTVKVSVQGPATDSSMDSGLASTSTRNTEASSEGLPLPWRCP